VFQLREFRNLTVRDVAKLTRFTIARVEDIESGLETWLSASDRQLLAKALAIEPVILQEVEARNPLDHSLVKADLEEQLNDAILSGRNDLECPNCGGTLKCSIEKALDIDGLPMQFPKAFCLKCPFVLK
jgi:transcriptional regulator with XRE-family HTH domain